MLEYHYIKRKPFSHINAYQRQIIVLALIPCFIFCTLLTAYILYFHRELINLVLYTTEPVSVKLINQWFIYVLLIVWSCFVMITVWTLTSSSRLVGAFERILRELDEVICGKSRKPIRARGRDRLANELLKRINILIDHLPGPRNEGEQTKPKGRI